MAELFNIQDMARFEDDKMTVQITHDSVNFRQLLFCFKAGQELPVHSHDVDSEVIMAIIDGEGAVIEDEKAIDVRRGDVVIGAVRIPHGIVAKTEMKVLVTITPPL
ncbi:MAG: cupin domain-containing protein [bacterium]|nr:cupin domain-containing protein [bacterium]